MTAAFPPDLLDAVRREKEVRIETSDGAGGEAHRAVIWVVVDDAARVLVRSYRGAGARWFREAMSGGPVALHVGAERVPVRVEPATDAERVESCSEALARKYAGHPSTPAMLRPEILDTTLQLLPA